MAHGDVYRMRPTHVALLCARFYSPVVGGLVAAYVAFADDDGDLGLALALLLPGVLPGVAVFARLLVVGTEVRRDGILVRRFWRTRMLSWSDIKRIRPDDAVDYKAVALGITDNVTVVLRDGRSVRLPYVEEIMLRDRGETLTTVSRRLNATWQPHRGPDRPELWVPSRLSDRVGQPGRSGWGGRGRPSRVRIGYGRSEVILDGMGWAVLAIIPALPVWFLLLIIQAPVPDWLPMLVIPLAGFVAGVTVSARRHR